MKALEWEPGVIEAVSFIAFCTVDRLYVNLSISALKVYAVLLSWHKVMYFIWEQRLFGIEGKARCQCNESIYTLSVKFLHFREGINILCAAL